MKTLYRNSFEVTSRLSERPLLDQLADEVWRWIWDRENPFFESDPPSGAITHHMQGGYERATVESIQTWDDASRRVFGFSFRHLGDTDSIEWITEGGIVEEGLQTCRFSLNLNVRRTDEGIAPFEYSHSSPRVIRKIIADYNCQSSYPIVAHPLSADNREIAVRLVDYILDSSRTHPILFVSQHEQSRSHLFDVREAARILAGLAYVVTAETQDVAREISDRLPPRHACYDGAVRLYWPSYSVNDEAFRHPLWVCSKIVEIDARGNNSFAQVVLRRLGEVFTLHSPKNFFSWSRVQEISRKRTISEAKEAGEQAQLITLYEEENSDLNQKVASLRLELQEKAEESRRLRSRVDAYEQAFKTRQNNSSDAHEAAMQLPVDSVAAAVERAQAEFTGKILFAFNSKSEHSYSKFQAPEEVYQAFEWMAKIYLDSKTGRRSEPDLNRSIRHQIPGWEYSHHQSEITMGQHREWYRCSYEGREYVIAEHLKKGTSFRPEEAIRIAFTFCGENQKVIVGYIGNHQRNT